MHFFARLRLFGAAACAAHAFHCDLTIPILKGSDLRC